MAILFGTSRADRLAGTEGLDIVLGFGGADSLEGAGGRDLLLGGPGADSILGGWAEAGAATTRVRDGDDTLRGGAGNDTILGGNLLGAAGDGDNLILGEEGDDSILAGWGADHVLGGAGNDVLVGYGSGFGIPFNALSDVLRREGADLLAGGAGDDRADGGGGADTLRGEAGADTLTGGYGADLLTGGEGADRFLFRAIRDVSPFRAPTPDTGTGEGARDVVTDFEQGTDLLDLSGYREVFRYPLPDWPEPVFLGTGGFVATHGLQIRYDILEDGRTILQFAVAIGVEPPREEAGVPAAPLGEVELTGRFELRPEDLVLGA